VEYPFAEERDAFIAKMKEHFAEIDEITQVVLKGHLMLEELFNSILQKCLFNPEVLDACNLRFVQKMYLVRGFCISPHGEGIWELVAAINALRNGIAHSLDREQRQKKFDRMKAIYLRELEHPWLADDDRDQPDHVVFLFAVGLCHGFIGRIESDAEMMGHIQGEMVNRMRKHLVRRAPSEVLPDHHEGKEGIEET
jgi:hypothetical protein